MINIICPVCGNCLYKKDRTYRCVNGHCFDEAREGYVNLLTGSKSGTLIGDSKDMARSRRYFLSKGCFSPLADKIAQIINQYGKATPAVCDICCGEGWYAEYIKNKADCEIAGFDISREMVRLAAKRKNNMTFFVANISKIPLEDSSVDICYHLFAPFHEKEFSRITKDDGLIITAVAGENHLFELKEILYEKPYRNDEKPPETQCLTLKEKIKVTDRIHLECKEDIDALFKMTPYFYHTSEKAKEKLSNLSELNVTIDFAIFIYQK